MISDVLPGTPIKQSTLTILGQKDNINTAVSVLTIEHGPSAMDDLAIAVYLATDTDAYLLGFTKEGWEVIEQVESAAELTHDDDTAMDWVMERGAFDWYVENGGDPDAAITTSITNAEGAPAFLQPDFD